MEMVLVKIMYAFLGFLLGVCLMILLSMAKKEEDIEWSRESGWFRCKLLVKDRILEHYPEQYEKMIKELVE